MLLNDWTVTLTFFSENLNTIDSKVMTASDQHRVMTGLFEARLGSFSWRSSSSGNSQFVKKQKHFSLSSLRGLLGILLVILKLFVIATPLILNSDSQPKDPVFFSLYSPEQVLPVGESDRHCSKMLEVAKIKPKQVDWGIFMLGCEDKRMLKKSKAFIKNPYLFTENALKSTHRRMRRRTISSKSDKNNDLIGVSEIEAFIPAADSDKQVS